MLVSEKNKSQSNIYGLYKVQAMGHVAINLLRFTVSPEQWVKNSHPPHPLSQAFKHWQYPPAYFCPSACPSYGPSVFPAWSLGIYSHRVPNDQPIFDQLLNLLMGVSIGDFIGVQPDLLPQQKTLEPCLS